MENTKLLSVRAFSRISGISPAALRYWDEIGLFQPDFRNDKTGYRYYFPERIVPVKFIKVLSNLGVPLKNIGEIEKERTPQGIIALLGQHEKNLNLEMRRLRDCYSVIHTLRDMMIYGMQTDEKKVRRVQVESSPIILGRPNHFEGEQPWHDSFSAFCMDAEKLRINLDYPVGGYWENAERFFAAPSQPDRFFSLDPDGCDFIEGGEYVEGFVCGNYGTVGDLPARINAYADEQCLTLPGPVYVLYVRDEISTPDPTNYLARVIILLKKHG